MVCVGPCGSVWIRVDPCGSVWIRVDPLGTYGSVRVRAGPCGPCGPCGSVWVRVVIRQDRNHIIKQGDWPSFDWIPSSAEVRPSHFHG